MRLKHFLFLILVALAFAGCKQPSEKITERWVFTDLKTPAARALQKAFSESYLQNEFAELNQKVQGNRLILNENGTCYGVLMNSYFTGEWTWSNVGPMVLTQLNYPRKLRLKWIVQKQESGSVQFLVDAENLLHLFQLSAKKLDEQDSLQAANWLASQTGDWIVSAEREKDKFNSNDRDPWSPGLNRWRLKPARSESKNELTSRVRNHLDFMYSFFNFICQEDERYWVSQDWFDSPIRTGNNGTALIAESKIPAQWYQCFYDSSQALKGYYMLKSAFYSDAIKIPTESNSLLFNKLMLQQLLKAFDKEYKN